MSDQPTVEQLQHTVVELTTQGCTWEFTFQMELGSAPADVVEALKAIALGNIKAKHLRGGM